MIKKAMIVTCLLATSLASHASLIEYNGYSRDTNSQIVKGGGLEWLMWDVTKGMSIEQAQANYGSEGWVLASNTHMAALFNAFSFGKSNWRADIVVASQNNFTPWDILENSSHIRFFDVFGTTWESSCATDDEKDYCYSDADPLRQSFARYEGDASANGLYSMAFVTDDYTLIYDYVNQQKLDGSASLQHALTSATNNSNNVGVALVRVAPNNPPQVSTPGSMGLLLLALAGFAYCRRKTGSR